MKNYIIYENETGDVVVEVALNTTESELLSIQQSLTEQGFIINFVCRPFIKCHKIGQGEEL